MPNTGWYIGQPLILNGHPMYIHAHATTQCLWAKEHTQDRKTITNQLTWDDVSSRCTRIVMSVAQLSSKRRGDIRCQVHMQMQRSRDDRHAPLGPALWKRQQTSETDRKTAAICYYITGSHLTRRDRRLDNCHLKKTAMQKSTHTWETQTLILIMN